MIFTDRQIQILIDRAKAKLERQEEAVEATKAEIALFQQQQQQLDRATPKK